MSKQISKTAGIGHLKDNSDIPVVVSSGVDTFAPWQIEAISSNTHTRADNGLVRFSPGGFEFETVSFLTGKWGSEEFCAQEHPIVSSHIRGQKVVIIPAYGPMPFLFSMLGAQEVIGFDADPITCTWQQAITDYFDDPLVGHNFIAGLQGLASELGLPDIIALVRNNVQSGKSTCCMENIQFRQGILGSKTQNNNLSILEQLRTRDIVPSFIYVPFLLGVKNGVETDEEVTKALEELWLMGKDGTVVMIGPFGIFDEEFQIRCEPEENPEILSRIPSLVPSDKFQIQILPTDPRSGFLTLKK